MTLQNVQYATAAQLRNVLNQAATNDDTRYNQVLKSASKYIELKTGRFWYQVVLENYIFDIHNSIYNLRCCDDTILFPSQITACTLVKEDDVTLTKNVDFWVDEGGSTSNDGGCLVRNGLWTQNRRNQDGTEGLKISLTFGYQTYPDDLIQTTIDLARYFLKKNVSSTMSSEGIESQIMENEIPVTVTKFISANMRLNA